MLSAHVMQAPDPLTRFGRGLSAPLEAVILKCLAKRPADRYQTAEELVTSLGATLRRRAAESPRLRLSRYPRLRRAGLGCSTPPASLADWPPWFLP